MNDNKPNPEQVFLDVIKIALLRHCLISKTEEQFMQKMTEGIFKILKNPDIKNIQQTYLNIINDMDDVMNVKINRLLTFKNLIKSTGRTMNIFKDISNFQARIDKLREEMMTLNIIPKSAKDGKEMLEKLGNNDPLQEGFKLMNDLKKYNEDIIKETEQHISTALAASSYTVSGLREALLDDPCSEK